MDESSSKTSADFAGSIRSVAINEEMRGSYLSYAMSVIVARALPDARDGLKPVHRRILYAMHDMGLRPGSSYKKSARLVGEVMGKYHPHGDQAIYDAMARLAQHFSLRYPLVDGQGNFGSQDGDKPAAMRYTEARMANIAGEMLTDINMDTVDFVENYDTTQDEPSVLPARLPNLLLNGASGIAVGMATNIPPHNLRELAAAITHLIDNYDDIESVTVDDLMEFVKGPDFPTGATIVVGDELKQAYANGKGRVVVRSSAHFEEAAGGGINIVFTSIPYQLSKSTIIERIVSLARGGRIEAIRDLRDESDRQGLRLVVELKRHAQPQRVLNQLYRFTQLQNVFSIQMLALVAGEPRTLPLKRCLRVYIEHRRDVIVRRSRYDLARQQARAHILSGLLKAVANIDAVIQTIRNSPDVEAARAQLIANFALDERQANAILDMQLRRLAALERQKLQDEYAAVQARIAYLEDLLASPQKVLQLIRDDIQEIAERYGDERKTDVVYGNIDFHEGDLYRRENVVISLTENGYIKRVAARHYRGQRRGGKGMRGFTLKDDDALLDVFIAYSHDTMLFFSDRGRVYSCSAYEIADTAREKRGALIQSLLPLEGDEKISAIFALPESQAEDEAGYFVLATAGGKIKRVEQREFMDIRRSGLVAMGLLPGDLLRWAKRTDGDQRILMATADGQCILFHESDVRAMGRQAAGVRGIKLRQGDQVVCMDVVGAEDSHVLVATKKGLGKVSALENYNSQGRGGMGSLTQRVTERSGPVVAARSVRRSDKLMLMLMTEKGKVLRTKIAEISVIGRNTQGVNLMDIDEDDEVAGIAIMRGEEEQSLPELEAADADRPANNGRLL
ncbi:MAG: DNA gyrase subunit A [Chloroflexi bacterium]|nr:DNA gyrase subunit A [Chloroflexota bacterium]